MEGHLTSLIVSNNAVNGKRAQFKIEVSSLFGSQGAFRLAGMWVNSPL
jgi:hypothetical protein